MLNKVPNTAAKRLKPTKIEWCTHVWNPVTGCTWKSSGCDYCYAKRCHERWSSTPFSKVVFHQDRLDAPLRTKTPQVVFVNSMGDLFHEDVPDVWLREVYNRIQQASWHQFIILTKRPERMYEWTTRGHFPLLPNLMLVVSVEDQETADARIPTLLQTPAALRGVSYEPALGPVDFNNLWDSSVSRYINAFRGYQKPRFHPLDVIIMGAESGTGARPMKREWAHDVAIQCAHADVPFFFKKDSDGNSTLYGMTYREWPEARGAEAVL